MVSDVDHETAGLGHLALDSPDLRNGAHAVRHPLVVPSIVEAESQHIHIPESNYVHLPGWVKAKANVNQQLSIVHILHVCPVKHWVILDQ